jgi:hypothetical protein
MFPAPAEANVAGKERRESVRLVEPVSLLGLSLGDFLLGLMETGEGQPNPRLDAAASAATEVGPALRLRMPDGRPDGAGRTVDSVHSRCHPQSSGATGDPRA